MFQNKNKNYIHALESLIKFYGSFLILTFKQVFSQSIKNVEVGKFDFS